MNRHLLISSGPVTLRSIDDADLENLRSWKNANRQAFFFKDEITLEGQRDWFQGYLGRAHDFMFVVEADGQAVGCMGFRLAAGAADCYNIIGAPQSAGRGLMTQAMKVMCSYILKEHAPRLGCKVLKTNPAVGWYQKCGYSIVSDAADYHQMNLDPAFKAVEYRIEGGKA